MSSSLARLAKLISDSVAAIESNCAAKGVDVPDINSLFDPASEAFRLDPGTAEAINIAAGAAFQLAAVLEPPFGTIGHIFGGTYRAASLHAMIALNVPEILREAGPQGLHVTEIAKRNNQDPKKLARMLRFLATYHVFREVSPNVFAHNRISCVLDTGKSVEELLANPKSKHDGTPGFAALVEHQIDDAGLSATAIVPWLLNEKTRFSEEPDEAPFNIAHHAKGDVFEFFDQPGQEYRRARFGVAMQGVAAMIPPESILSGFDWKSLKSGDLIVDVGSGVGGVSLALAKANPDVRIVLQDRARVMEQAELIWNKQLPDALQSGRVQLRAHDFFKEQPIKNATVFLMKQIVHDWSDTYARKILVELHKAATDKTRLVLVESLTSYACHDHNADRQDALPGSAPREAPAPLIANYGPVNDMQYNGDLTVFVQNNAQERTVDHMVALCKEAGWKVVKVYRSDGMTGFMQQIEAVKI